MGANLGLWLALVTSSIPAFSQEPAVPRQSLSREIQEIREKMRLLQEQLDSLEKRHVAAEPTAPAPVMTVGSMPRPVAAAALQSDAVPSESESSTPLDLNGYYSFRYLNDTRAANPGTFQAHVLSLFFGKKLGRWRFFSEAELEYAPAFDSSGVTFSTHRGEVLLETAWLDYNHRDWLNARGGLLLVPTYWRVHHYPSTTLTVQNPLIDKRIFPGDIVGVMAHGSRYFSRGGLDYTIYAGNGRGVDQGRQDINENKAIGGSFVYHVPTQEKFDTVDLGMQWYRDTLANRDREKIYGFEAKIEKGRLGFLGELAHATLGPSGGARRLFREGYYLQPSLRLSRKAHLVYRYDLLNYDSRLSDARDLRRHTFGFGYRPTPTVSLKLEFNHYKPEQRPGTYTGLAAGLSFFFQ